VQSGKDSPKRIELLALPDENPRPSGTWTGHTRVFSFYLSFADWIL